MNYPYLKIGLCANTKSGKNKFIRKGYYDRFQKIAQAQTAEDNKNQVFFRPTKTLEEIPKSAKDFQANNVDIIAIFGGDGTIQKTLTTLVDVYKNKLPPILLLGGGTMNLVSKSLKLKGSPEYRLRNFFTKANKNNIAITFRKSMRINKELGFMYGLGLPCNFIDLYNEGGDTGPWKVIKMILLIFIRAVFGGDKAKRLFAPLEGEFEVDGKKIPFRKCTAVLVQTIPNLAFGFHLTYRAYEKEATAHAIISQASPIALLSRFFHILFRKRFYSAKIINELISSIVVKPKKPCIYMIDGEIFFHQDPNEPITQEMGPVIAFAQLPE